MRGPAFRPGLAFQVDSNRSSWRWDRHFEPGIAPDSDLPSRGWYYRRFEPGLAPYSDRPSLDFDCAVREL